MKHVVSAESHSRQCRSDRSGGCCTETVLLNVADIGDGRDKKKDYLVLDSSDEAFAPGDRTGSMAERLESGIITKAADRIFVGKRQSRRHHNWRSMSTMFLVGQILYRKTSASFSLYRIGIESQNGNLDGSANSAWKQSFITKVEAPCRHKHANISRDITYKGPPTGLLQRGPAWQQRQMDKNIYRLLVANRNRFRSRSSALRRNSQRTQRGLTHGPSAESSQPRRKSVNEI